MGIGISIFLIAVGAILTFAVEFVAEDVNLETVGIILMVVGAVGLLASMTIFGSMGGRGDTETVVHETRRP